MAGAQHWRREECTASTAPSLVAASPEIFAERWTPLIIRNLYLGCGTFSGDPGWRARTLPHLFLTAAQAARTASRSSDRHPSPTGAGTTTSSRLRATTSSRSASRSASGVRVGSRLPPRTSTPLWPCGRCATRSAGIGSRIWRVVIRFDFTGRPRHERYWLLIELGDTEICRKSNAGLDEDLYITAEAEAFVKWHAGQLTWAQATRDGRIQLDGLPSLVRAFPTWNARASSPTSGRSTTPPRAPQADIHDALGASDGPAWQAGACCRLETASMLGIGSACEAEALHDHLHRLPV